MKRFTREELEKETRDNLRKIAKQYEIAGRHNMNKAQLIDAIFSACENAEGVESEESVTNAFEDTKKFNYIDTAPIGTIVAFRSETGKVKSAMIINRSSSRQLLKLETQYGAQFVVKYSDVIWVRTNSRWPRGVFNLLKGIMNTEEGVNGNGDVKN